MKLAVILLNFGEPENPTLEEVIPFLERIFTVNSPLMAQPNPSMEEIRERSRVMAEARGPGLIEEYQEIGGSPLHPQAREQAEKLEIALRERGHDVSVLLGMQFTRPSIREALENARAHGADFLVPLAVYPLCGPSTTVAAQAEIDRELKDLGWDVEMRQVTGWHRHPDYVKVRAEAIRETLNENGLDLADPRTRLVFSAHGTPIKYLREGSRYDEYVKEFCAAVARELDAPGYELGYQNHTNRPGIEWTQPDIDKVIESVDADRVVVDAVSFMHEQSETLAELDHELREEAEERGLGFFRVPIPYAVPRFIGLMADLVEAVIPTVVESAEEAPPVKLFPCRCKPTAGTFCTNGGS